MHLAFILGALAASITFARETASQLLNGTELLAGPPSAVRAAHRNHTRVGRNASVVVRYETTTLTTITRTANATLSVSPRLNGTATRTAANSTNGTATRDSTTPTPTMPYRCAMRDCRNHPKDKDRDRCYREAAEKCKKEWESIQSQVWATNSLVDDGQGFNARKTLIKMDSAQFAAWKSSMTTMLRLTAPEPTVDVQL